MNKIIKQIQLIVLLLILISAIVAIGLEVQKMFITKSVELADLLLMFLYLEVLAMIRIFWESQEIRITLPLLIAITALSRFIILQGKEQDPSALVYEATAILLIAAAIVAVVEVLLYSKAPQEVLHTPLKRCTPGLCRGAPVSRRARRRRRRGSPSPRRTVPRP